MTIPENGSAAKPKEESAFDGAPDKLDGGNNPSIPDNAGNSAATHPSTVDGSGGGFLTSSIRSLQSAARAASMFEGHGQSKGCDAPFHVTPSDLGELSNERTRLALADLLDAAMDDEEKRFDSSAAGTVLNGASTDDFLDEESPPTGKKKSVVVTVPSESRSEIRSLTSRMRSAADRGPFDEHSEEAALADADAELAAIALTSAVLRSSVHRGLDPDPSNLDRRASIFGRNAIADKKLDSFLKLCWDAVQDFVLIMLIALGIVSIVVETTIGLDDGESCGACWIEGAAILMSVCIVVLVTAGIDYAKQFAFVRLTKSLDETNTKSVIRNGEVLSVVDADIVVGDILSVNSHNLASIPADCVLLGPSSGSDLKMDESTLTGESKLIAKKPGDVVLSGTTAVQGSGKMVVIAVGIHSVAGKIKARVYESSEGSDDDLEGDDESPLFAKLTLIAKQIGAAGTVAAVVAFAASCIIGLAINGESASMLVDYFIVAVTVLAVAVPEGLPLAVTLALAFSSNKMMKDMNLVKHLDACETMGCATTICTDKTGTLTANKMTARALYVANRNFVCTHPSVSLGEMVLRSTTIPSDETLTVVANCIAVDTMNETVLHFDDETDSSMVTGSSGNPTEVALLQLARELGHDYRAIRDSTPGRSDKGDLAARLSDGKQFGFSSARKMMSWAVPLEGGGYRLYSKGASEVILSRCASQLVAGGFRASGDVEPLGEEKRSAAEGAAESFARRGMRCLALAYKDLPDDVDFDEVSSSGVKNSDGSDALAAETDMVFCALVGIEDPLRPEVPDAIAKCYEAGIDVRLVTGDSPNTAVSIAYQAGILRPHHFRRREGHADDEEPEMVAAHLKENVLMEGKAFRNEVYRLDGDGKKEFDQQSFDRIWPHLRVLARSSPDDKLTLAHGLNQSTLFADVRECRKLRTEDDIIVFPDRQVIAMTGDGTNDAPALKRADIGFAMGIAGTQIAKDAADIILLDDNFASIVTAAKWGRNVYASIQKFLQFQLTVNIAAVVTALVGAFAYQTSPLAAIQLLWVNLLMDSLASLALASEPPVDALLKKPPVNRTRHMITKRMWSNMLGHASYQIIVVMVLLFAGPDLFDIKPGHLVEKEDKENSVHYTIIFNTFVWMQLFNEVNCRMLKGEVQVWKGISKNPLFCGILLTTSILQVIMVEFGSYALHVADGGLDAKYWGVSLICGFGSLPVQQIINVVFKVMQRAKMTRDEKRVRRDAKLTTRHVGGDDDLLSLRSDEKESSA